MGKHLAKHVKPPDQIITSPASRAFYTALFVADAWCIDENKLTLNNALYHADQKTLLDIIRRTVETDVLAIFGHNPGLTSLINCFHINGINNLPTCGIIGFTLDIENWRDLNSARLTPKFYYTPRSIEEDTPPQEAN
jgi:phosphohistidine phosphatase